MLNEVRFDARTVISVTRLLGLACDGGPFAVITKTTNNVHLRQGDIDGACGPYALVMAMIAMDLISRESATSLDRADRRTRAGKFAEGLRDLGPLVSAGTIIDDVQWLADLYKNEGLQAYSLSGRPREIAKEVSEAIDDGGAAIVGIDWQGGGGHWMLAVGHQGCRMDSSEPHRLTHLLCLDPSQNTPKTSLWNSVLYLTLPIGGVANSGPYSAIYWGMDGNEKPCRLSEAVILKRPNQIRKFFGDLY